MTLNNLQIISDILKKAKAQGASSGDVVMAETESSEVQVRMGTVDKLSSAREKRLGLRLFFGQRTAITSTADLSQASLDELVSTTCALAQATSEDRFSGLPEENPAQEQTALEHDLDIWDPELMNLSMEEQIRLAQKAEIAALEEDQRITNSEGGDLSLYSRRVAYANTQGFAGTYKSSSVSLSVTPIATSNGNMQRDYWYSTKRKFSQLEAPEDIGREAAQRTLRRLGGRKVSTISCPVVFDPETASELMATVSSAVSGHSIYKESSFLVGKLGQRIASDGVTIFDDGTFPSGLGTRPFDGEGLPTRQTVVVRNGILESYLLDSYSARKLGFRSTGNAARGVGGFPSVSPTNFYLSKGEHSPESIIKSVKNGLYITELIGFGVNLVNGDYSRGASGIWIENGELAFPVEGITIAGNLKDMLQQIAMIGNDLEFRENIVSPTLLISKMMVAGD